MEWSELAPLDGPELTWAIAVKQGPGPGSKYASGFVGQFCPVLERIGEENKVFTCQ